MWKKFLRRIGVERQIRSVIASDLRNTEFDLNSWRASAEYSASMSAMLENRAERLRSELQAIDEREKKAPAVHLIGGKTAV